MTEFLMWLPAWAQLLVVIVLSWTVVFCMVALLGQEETP
jgi:hypothetical protein